MPKNIYLIILFFAVYGCSPSSHVFPKSQAWIPSDFKPEHGVLLIEKQSKKQQEKSAAFMKENYPYKYAFADRAEIEKSTGEFADTSNYRFAIFNETQHRSSMSSSGRMINYTSTDFRFYDRAKKTSYPLTGKGSSFSSVTFMPMINSILEANK